MATGMQRASELRHPERAAAWLRARVLREARNGGIGRTPAPRERHAVLAELGLAAAATDALAQLTLEERSALIAATIERLATPDVATVLGRDLPATRRSVTRARVKYLAAATHWMRDLPPSDLPKGEIAQQIEEDAARAIGRQPVDLQGHD
jgi:DNA-directed RNA polymerase specialized sigma24 family protein